jgi:quercetin 2,3-dioxygenase
VLRKPPDDSHCLRLLAQQYILCTLTRRQRLPFPVDGCRKNEHAFLQATLYHNATEGEMSTKSVSSLYQLHKAVHTNEGTDFWVHRLLHLDSFPHFDPLVLFDELGPDVEAGDKTGFGVHPHAGLEVFTYVLEGTMEGQIMWPKQGVPVSVSEGGTMWINFGAGGAHFERPMRSVIEHGGRCHSVQLWFSLPSAAKKSEAVVGQEFTSKENPVWTNDDGQVKVRVLLGEGFGMKAPAKICAEASYFHVSLAHNASVDLPVPTGHVALAYTLSGSAEIGGVIAEPRQSVLRHIAPGDAPASAGVDGAELLFVTGRPLNEPIVQSATFVMNSMDEIGDCFQKFGHFLNIEFG